MKKVAYSKTKGDFHYAGTQPQGAWALYDVTADPAQMKNLAEAQPKTVAELATEYEGSGLLAITVSLGQEPDREHRFQDRRV